MADSACLGSSVSTTRWSDCCTQDLVTRLPPKSSGFDHLSSSGLLLSADGSVNYVDKVWRASLSGEALEQMLSFLQFLIIREWRGVRANAVFSTVSQHHQARRRSSECCRVCSFSAACDVFELTAGVCRWECAVLCAQVNRSDKLATGKVIQAIEQYLLWAASCEGSLAPSSPLPSSMCAASHLTNLLWAARGLRC